MLRVGIVGCGKIADGHVEQVRATGRGEVVAVCDREGLMAEQLALRFGVPAHYDDFDAMLRHQRLDVVHIATPPDSHVPLACRAVEAGCHVFVEKPFALTRRDAATIVECAGRHGKKVGVNYLYNFESCALELEALLARTALGRIVHLDTQYGYNLAGDYGVAVMSDPAHWVHRLPGRLFHNVLDHVLAKLVPHLDDDLEIHAMAFRRRAPTGERVVDSMPDELRFMLRSGSVTAAGVVSAHARPVAHTLKVVGTEDSVELDYANRTLVRSARQTQPSAVGRLLPAWRQAGRYAGNAWRNARRFRRHEFHYFQCMRVLLHRYYDAVEQDGPDPVPAEQILRVCHVIDELVARIPEAA